MIFIKPHPHVIEYVLTDFATPVIGPGLSPRCYGAIIIIEVDATSIVLRPTIKLPLIKITRTEVIVDHVKDDSDACLMGALDEPFQSNRAAIIRIHSKEIRWIVAP